MHFTPPPLQPSLPIELAVVGERTNDPEHLLLIGADGAYYDYAVPSGDTRPIEPDEQWTVESVSLQDLFM